MLKIRKYAAIDIGSNAVRLLVSTITEPENKETTFKKTSLVRVPIRLGADVFVNGKNHNYKTQGSALIGFAQPNSSFETNDDGPHTARTT